MLAWLRALLHLILLVPSRAFAPVPAATWASQRPTNNRRDAPAISVPPEVRKIARDLTERGIEAPRSGAWNAMTVMRAMKRLRIVPEADQMEVEVR